MVIPGLLVLEFVVVVLVVVSVVVVELLVEVVVVAVVVVVVISHAPAQNLDQPCWGASFSHLVGQ